MSKKVAAVTMALPAPELVLGHAFSKSFEAWPLVLDVAQSWQLERHPLRVCGESGKTIDKMELVKSRCS